MKLFKKTLVVLGTLVTLIMLFSLFAINTAALSPDYYGEDNTIYYYYDYYPSVDKETMENVFGGGYYVFYDHQWEAAQIFRSGYFYGLGDDCVLILDIKTFTPDYDNLALEFSALKYSEPNLKIVLVVGNDIGIPSELFDIVDIFFPSNLGRLETFIDCFVDNFAPVNTSLANSTILIDGRLIDLNNMSQYNKNDLIEESPFMRMLIKKLAARMGISSSNYNYDYNYVLGILKNNYNINLLIYSECDDQGIYDIYEYVDLYTMYTFTAETVEYFYCDESGEELLYSKICGVGFWHLENGFYNFLINGQEIMGDMFPVYLMESDPLIYGNEGVSVIADTDLCQMSNEEAALLEILEDLLGYS